MKPFVPQPRRVSRWEWPLKLTAAALAATVVGVQAWNGHLSVHICGGAIAGAFMIWRPSVYNPGPRTISVPIEGCALVTGWVFLLYAIVMTLLLHSR